MMPAVRLAVTMTIVKRGGDLTIFNSTRVSKEVEEEIKKLGTIKNVVRLSGNHGSADEYYIDTFKATYWDLPGAAEAQGATKVPKADKMLSEGVGGFAPIPEANILFVKSIKIPEGMVWLPDDGGTLISGDFIQNGRPTPYNSCGGKMLKAMMGFNTGCCNTPSPFFQFYGKGEDIYAPNVPTVLELKFDTIISGMYTYTYTYTHS